ncbi:MAG: efflux RND transporter periplasmic adaptor subunit [Betaproteobacteria bacterium]|nr:efflux RND transporter periplasmic adaptor subunit [Betaproteobacteria bacterium]
MKKRWWLGAAAVVLLGAAGLGAWYAGLLPGPAGLAEAGTQAGRWGKDGKDGKKPDVPLEFVAREVVQPALARLPALIEFSGPLVAPQTAVVRARAGGTLVELRAAEGQRVAAGQPIGRIDVAELTSRVAERNAMLESARAALAQTERTHASNERLAQQNFISPIALENSRAGLEAARAHLGAAQASLETTRVATRDTVVTAPIAGIVARRHVLPGEKVSPEQQLVTIVDITRLELAGTVGTHEVARLAPGLPVQVQVEGMPAALAGRIARIAPAAEPGTRSIGVTIELANPKETLRAGQYAIVRTTLADDTERLTLPASAVGHAGGEDHVWVIERGVLARRAVTLGRRETREGREGRVEVLQGVTPASVVLAVRFDNLREGARASVVGDRSAPVASAAASAAAAR